jgi:class 3 adenylate cyclase/YHS domain-containing protein
MTTSDEPRTVAFADLAGFTALTEAHGDSSAANVAERFVELAVDLLRDDARLVKTIGDAVMITSTNPQTGLRFGLDLLRNVENEHDFPGVRVGLHHGPTIERNGDLFGTTVNIAARLTAHAHVGQLLTTEVIATLVVQRHDLSAVNLGATVLKNITEAVEIYEVKDHTPQPTSQVLDPVCRMYVDADAAPARLPWADRIWHFCSFECAAAFAQNPGRHGATE